MIHIDRDSLDFSFPAVHEDAELSVHFQRTLRIPDDDRVHHLPPGLGAFPLRQVDDFARGVPPRWLEHGGVMLPMYQSEAMWIFYGAHYPFAVKIAAGKINAITGEPWAEGLHRDPQDYMVLPEQPWLDGFAVRKGEIRQFVAMPLGDGYTAEEQLTGEAEHGGLQILVYPMKREAYEKLRRKRERDHLSSFSRSLVMGASLKEMGLAPGGRMKQQIFQDRHAFDVWDLRHSARCFVHIVNSRSWMEITGERPPTMPPTAKQYTDAGLPWFDYYAADAKALEGAERLKGLKSVAKIGAEKGEPLSGNEAVDAERVIRIRAGLGRDEVREGRF